MANVRITKRVVDALEKTGTEYFIWDADLIGFGVRVRESGAMSYVAKYRAGAGRNAPTRRITLGAVGKLTPDEARRLAKIKLGEAATGGDPAADRAKERAEMTVAQLCDLYLSEGCDTKKPRTLLNDKSRINRHIKPLIGTKRVGDITGADVAKVMRDVANGATAMNQKTDKAKGRAIVTGGKGVANQVVLLLSAIFAFAISRQIRTDNPATGVKKYPTGRGERYLTTDELERLGAAIREAETVGIEWEIAPERAASATAKHTPKNPENRRTKIGPHVAGALRLLIMTGARLREILHLEWSHVDMERGLLFLPDSKTGRKTVILNAPALAVLAGLPRIGRFVIASDSAGTKNEKTRSDLSRPWALVSRRASLEGVRLHDLRHTHASFGAAAGLGLPIIGKLLGHTQASTTARYAHLDADPLRKASDRIGGDIARAMGDASPDDDERAEVVPLRRGGNIRNRTTE